MNGANCPVLQAGLSRTISRLKKAEVRQSGAYRSRVDRSCEIAHRRRSRLRGAIDLNEGMVLIVSATTSTTAAEPVSTVWQLMSSATSRSDSDRANYFLFRSPLVSQSELPGPAGQARIIWCCGCWRRLYVGDLIDGLRHCRPPPFRPRARQNKPECKAEKAEAWSAAENALQSNRSGANLREKCYEQHRGRDQALQCYGRERTSP